MKYKFKRGQFIVEKETGNLYAVVTTPDKIRTYKDSNHCYIIRSYGQDCDHDQVVILQTEAEKKFDVRPEVESIPCSCGQPVFRYEYADGSILSKCSKGCGFRSSQQFVSLPS